MQGLSGVPAPAKSSSRLSVVRLSAVLLLCLSVTARAEIYPRTEGIRLNTERYNRPWRWQDGRDYFATLLADITTECDGAALMLSDGTAVSFTRASAATCTKSTGVIVGLTNNQPRVTMGTGLLVEGLTTNRVINSEDFSSWTCVNTTVTANSTVAPDLTTTGDTLTSTVAGGYCQSTPFTMDGIAGTISVYAKTSAGTQTFGMLFRDVTAGTDFCSATPTATTQWPALVTGRYGCTIPSTVISANSHIMRIYPGGVAGTGTVIVWGAQVENKNGATSYVATGATMVSRSADESVSFVPSRPMNLAGCVSVTAQFPMYFAGNQVLINLASLWNVPMYWAGATSAGMADNVNFPPVESLGGDARGRSIVLRSGWGGTSMRLDINGGVGTSRTYDGTMGTNIVYLGSGGGSSNFFFGWLRNLKFGTSPAGCVPL